MRLIIEFSVGDGYTYSATETIPVVYESAEAFAVDFEQAVRDNWATELINRGNVKIGGQEFDSGEFMMWDDSKDAHEYFAPNIFTVDEWFKHRGCE